MSTLLSFKIFTAATKNKHKIIFCKVTFFSYSNSFWAYFGQEDTN